MSHHRLLAPAAWPRPGTALAGRRLTLFVLVLLSLPVVAPCASAEMVYYTEDFCHEGEPGFDPMFNHEFIEPSGYPDYMYPMWEIRPPMPGVSDEYRLAMIHGTKDVITFNLAEHENIVSAAVTATSGLTAFAYVKFIGTRGEWQTSPEHYQQKYFEVSYESLGFIQAIELSEPQGGTGFSTITIGVIPEPTIPLLMLCGFISLARFRRHKSRTTV